MLRGWQDYNLGPHSTLVVNNLTHVAGSLQKAGLMTLPMISSYPYGAERCARFNLLASPLLCMWAATRRSSCRGCGRYGLTPRPSSMTACRSTWWWGCGHVLLLNVAHGFARAAAQGFSGFNVDWEPASGTITPQDPLE